MFVLKIIIYALSFLAITLTILPFSKLDVWWVRIGDFPRLQIAFLCGVAAVLFLFLRYPLKTDEIVILFLLSACTLYQFYCILPYTPVYPKQVETAKNSNEEKQLKILISNVFIDNEEKEKLVKLVKKYDPDIFSLAEPDEKWLEEISELEKDYEYNVKCPLDNAYGLALYSRLELIDPQIKFLIEEDIPSIHTDLKLASGDVIKLYCLHPRPPIPPENSRSTERDAELILAGREIGELDEPTIVMGDLNDVAWSRTTILFQKISGLLDPRIGRGLYSSFNAKYPFIRFPLDHLFHSEHFRLVKLKRLESIGSDHFPIFVVISYEESAEYSQKEPEADAEDKKEAEETLEKAEEKIGGMREKRESFEQ